MLCILYLSLTRIPGADSGIEVNHSLQGLKFQGETLLGPREQSSWIHIIGLKTCLPRSHFYYISVIITGVEFINKIYKAM
jgi:hypothetical protein